MGPAGGFQIKADNHTTLRNFTSYCTSPMSFPPPRSRAGISQKVLNAVKVGKKAVSSYRKIFIWSTADSCTGVQRWETLQNISTVFQNKHLRVYLPQSIKIGLKQRWYGTFFSSIILMVCYL